MTNEVGIKYRSSLERNKRRILLAMTDFACFFYKKLNSNQKVWKNCRLHQIEGV